MEAREISAVVSALVVLVGGALVVQSATSVLAATSPAVRSGHSGTLIGISGASPTDALAVGDYTNPTAHAQESFVALWNGINWKVLASPNPGGTKSSSDVSHLSGVSTDSTTDAWAVGDYTNPTTHAHESFILHWNGTIWSEVAGPNPGGTQSSSDNTFLSGVSADSATDAWAVGNYTNPTAHAQESFVLHWNGINWSDVASPSPGGTKSSSDVSDLSGVSADSATDAWAVGDYTNPTTHAHESFVLRWNGTSWDVVASPNPGGTESARDASHLSGVSADSATSGWAVGAFTNPTTHAHQTLALRWSGTSWSEVSSPNPGGTRGATDTSDLIGVSAALATDAWAVGDYNNPTTHAHETFVLHWDGTAWSEVASPIPGGTASSSDRGFLMGVSADSATDAWAAGDYTNPATHAHEWFVLHWNGTKPHRT